MLRTLLQAREGEIRQTVDDVMEGLKKSTGFREDKTQEAVKMTVMTPIEHQRWLLGERRRSHALSLEEAHRRLDSHFPRSSASLRRKAHTREWVRKSLLQLKRSAGTPEQREFWQRQWKKLTTEKEKLSLIADLGLDEGASLAEESSTDASRPPAGPNASAPAERAGSLSAQTPSPIAGFGLFEGASLSAEEERAAVSNASTPAGPPNASTTAARAGSLYAEAFACLQLDIDISALVGIPLFIHVGILGSVGANSERCFKWNLEVMLGVSFSVSLGFGLKVAFGISLGGSISAREVPWADTGVDFSKLKTGTACKPVALEDPTVCHSNPFRVLLAGIKSVAEHASSKALPQDDGSAVLRHSMDEDRKRYMQEQMDGWKQYRGIFTAEGGPEEGSGAQSSVKRVRCLGFEGHVHNKNQAAKFRCIMAAGRFVGEAHMYAPGTQITNQMGRSGPSEGVYQGKPVEEDRAVKVKWSDRHLPFANFVFDEKAIPHLRVSLESSEPGALTHPDLLEPFGAHKTRGKSKLALGGSDGYFELELQDMARVGKLTVQSVDASLGGKIDKKSRIYCAIKPDLFAVLSDHGNYWWTADSWDVKTPFWGEGFAWSIFAEKGAETWEILKARPAFELLVYSTDLHLQAVDGTSKEQTIGSLDAACSRPKNEADCVKISTCEWKAAKLSNLGWAHCAIQKGLQARMEAKRGFFGRIGDALHKTANTIGQFARDVGEVTGISGLIDGMAAMGDQEEEEWKIHSGTDLSRGLGRACSLRTKDMCRGQAGQCKWLGETCVSRVPPEVMKMFYSQGAGYKFYKDKIVGQVSITWGEILDQRFKTPRKMLERKLKLKDPCKDLSEERCALNMVCKWEKTGKVLGLFGSGKGCRVGEKDLYDSDRMGGTVKVRIAWSPQQAELPKDAGRTRPPDSNLAELAFAGSGLQAAFTEFSGKLPKYAEQVLERLFDSRFAPDKSGIDCEKAGCKVVSWDGAGGHRLERRFDPNKDDVAYLDDDDAPKDDRVINFPKGMRKSVYRHTPFFWWQSALGLADLFVRVVADVQAIWLVYFADDVGWDGKCESLKPMFDLPQEVGVLQHAQYRFEPQTANSRAHRHSAPTNYTRGPKLAEPGMEQWDVLEAHRTFNPALEYHWAYGHGYEEDRPHLTAKGMLRFFSRDAPTRLSPLYDHGEESIHHAFEGSPSPVVYTHLWCDLAKSYYRRLQAEANQSKVPKRSSGINSYANPDVEGLAREVAGSDFSLGDDSDPLTLRFEESCVNGEDCAEDNGCEKVRLDEAFVAMFPRLALTIQVYVARMRAALARMKEQVLAYRGASRDGTDWETLVESTEVVKRMKPSAAELLDLVRLFLMDLGACNKEGGPMVGGLRNGKDDSDKDIAKRSSMCKVMQDLQGPSRSLGFAGARKRSASAFGAGFVDLPTVEDLKSACTREDITKEEECEAASFGVIEHLCKWGTTLLSFGKKKCLLKKHMEQMVKERTSALLEEEGPGPRPTLLQQCESRGRTQQKQQRDEIGENRTQQGGRARRQRRRARPSWGRRRKDSDGQPQRNVSNEQDDAAAKAEAASQPQAGQSSGGSSWGRRRKPEGQPQRNVSNEQAEAANRLQAAQSSGGSSWGRRRKPEGQPQPTTSEQDDAGQSSGGSSWGRRRKPEEAKKKVIPRPGTLLQDIHEDFHNSWGVFSEYPLSFQILPWVNQRLSFTGAIWHELGPVGNQLANRSKEEDDKMFATLDANVKERLNKLLYRTSGKGKIVLPLMEVTTSMWMAVETSQPSFCLPSPAKLKVKASTTTVRRTWDAAIGRTARTSNCMELMIRPGHFYMTAQGCRLSSKGAAVKGTDMAISFFTELPTSSSFPEVFRMGIGLPEMIEGVLSGEVISYFFDVPAVSAALAWVGHGAAQVITTHLIAEDHVNDAEIGKSGGPAIMRSTLALWSKMRKAGKKPNVTLDFHYAMKVVDEAAEKYGLPDMDKLVEKMQDTKTVDSLVKDSFEDASNVVRRKPFHDKRRPPALECNTFCQGRHWWEEGSPKTIYKLEDVDLPAGKCGECWKSSTNGTDGACAEETSVLRDTLTNVCCRLHSCMVPDLLPVGECNTACGAAGYEVSDGDPIFFEEALPASRCARCTWPIADCGGNLTGEVRAKVDENSETQAWGCCQSHNCTTPKNQRKAEQAAAGGRASLTELDSQSEVKMHDRIEGASEAALEIKEALTQMVAAVRKQIVSKSEEVIDGMLQKLLALQEMALNASQSVASRSLAAIQDQLRDQVVYSATKLKVQLTFQALMMMGNVKRQVQRLVPRVTAEIMGKINQTLQVLKSAEHLQNAIPDQEVAGIPNAEDLQNAVQKGKYSIAEIPNAEDLQNAVQEKKEDIAQKAEDLQNAVQEKTEDIAQKAEDLQNDIQKKKELLAQKAEDLQDDLQKRKELLAQKAKDLQDDLQKRKELIAQIPIKLQSVINALVARLQQLIVLLGERLKDKLTQAKSVVKEMLRELEQQGLKLVEMKDSLKKLTGAPEKMVAEVKDNIMNLKNDALEAMKNITKIVDTRGVKAVRVAMKYWDMMLYPKAVTMLPTQLLKGVQEVRKKVKWLVGRATSAINNTINGTALRALNTVKAIQGQLKELIFETLPKTLDRFMEAMQTVGEVPGTLVGTLSSTVEELEANLTGVAGWAKETFAAVVAPPNLTGVAETFAAVSAAPNLSGVSGSLAEQASQGVAVAPDALVKQVFEALSGMPKALAGQASELLTQIPGKLTKVFSKSLEKMQGELKSFTAKVLNGFEERLQNMTVNMVADLHSNLKKQALQMVNLQGGNFLEKSTQMIKNGLTDLLKSHSLKSVMALAGLAPNWNWSMSVTVRRHSRTIETCEERDSASCIVPCEWNGEDCVDGARRLLAGTAKAWEFHVVVHGLWKMKVALSGEGPLSDMDLGGGVGVAVKPVMGLNMHFDATELLEVQITKFGPFRAAHQKRVERCTACTDQGLAFCDRKDVDPGWSTKKHDVCVEPGNATRSACVDAVGFDYDWRPSSPVWVTTRDGCNMMPLRGFNGKKLVLLPDGTLIRVP